MRLVFIFNLLVLCCFHVKIGLSSYDHSNKNDLEDPEEKKICVICLDELKLISSEEKKSNMRDKSQLSLKRLKCQEGVTHTFHEKCLNIWVYEYQNFSCPICRKEITPSIYQLNCRGKIKEIKRRYSKTLLCFCSCVPCTVFLAAGFVAYKAVVSFVAAYDEVMTP